MSDGLSGVGSAPFNVQSDIHQQTQSRERVEAHLAEQRVTKEHRANHAHTFLLTLDNLSSSHVRATTCKDLVNIESLTDSRTSLVFHVQANRNVSACIQWCDCVTYNEDFKDDKKLYVHRYHRNEKEIEKAKVVLDYWVKELKKYRADIDTLNKNRKEKPNQYGKTLFPGAKRTHYDNMRGELSSLFVTNRVNKILQDWFNNNSKVSGDEPNKVDMFIRILYRYVTSRSETSAKFVIAKS